MPNAYNEFLSFAGFLADEAAMISRRYFRQSLIIDNKTNNTPVTLADREIEMHLRQLIKEHYPLHGIIGEEFTNQCAQSEYTWVLDPIDGTVAFSCGKPTFTTLIALLENNQPLLSIIDQSISRERFVGVNASGSYLNDEKITTSEIVRLSDVRLNATTPYMFKTSKEWESFDLLKQEVKLVSFGGDAYSFALLAAGHIDVIMEADLQYYDVAALIPVINSAGGVISDWQGNALTPDFNGQCLACANITLQQRVLAILNGN